MYKVFYMECLILTVLLLRVAIVKMNFIFRIRKFSLSMG